MVSTQMSGMWARFLFFSVFFCGLLGSTSNAQTRRFLRVVMAGLMQLQLVVGLLCMTIGASQKSILDGHCEPYDGEICLGFGLKTGDMIWVWSGYGSQKLMHSILGGLFQVFETLLLDQCLAASKETLCDSHYARCLEVENEKTGEVIPTPQLLCNARCRYKADRYGGVL
jgi:hypothetical protein